MITNYHVSWGVGREPDGSGGNAKNLSLIDMECLLSRAWEKSGSVTLRLLDSSDVGPQTLQTQIDRNRAIVTLSVLTENDYEVRSYWRGLPVREVDILGDLWDSRSICTDIELIVDIFHEFMENGDVSSDKLR
jgi:hypothetical protein